ncbi:hypothetical protein INR28_27945, partial [Klebsiella pneumoniae]
LSEMFRTMTAIGNGSFAGNRFIPLALVLLTLALASPFFATFYTMSRSDFMATTACYMAACGRS